MAGNVKTAEELQVRLIANHFNEWMGLKIIALDEEKTCGQIAINWVLRQAGLVTALVGVKNSAQMEENLKATSWQPSKENCEKIETIFDLTD